MSVFRIVLALACTICLAGILRRYLRRSVIQLPSRPAHTPFRPWRTLGTAIATFCTEVILLWRTARTSPRRWLTHSLIFFGFMGLLIFHALDDVISRPFMSGYESTLDPWQWLRNLFGAMALAGVGLAVFRRLHNHTLRSLSHAQDWLLLVTVAAIIGSGFALEASKIISPNVFGRMVDTYFIAENDSDIPALQAYWSAQNGVLFSPAASTDRPLIEKGAELSANNCNYCHAPTSSAFVSRALATAISPAAHILNAARTEELLWYVHIGLALLALALMPYGKFMHPVATPLNLLARLGARGAAYPPSSQPAEPPLSPHVAIGSAGTGSRNLGLEACTRCGECSLHCSVAPAYTVIGNANILPSEKLLSLRKYMAGTMSQHDADAFAEGSRICTECLRCTAICPSGINLQDLWLASKQTLAQHELTGPNTTIRQCTATQWAEVLSAQGKSRFEQIKGNGLADRAESFWGCVQCTTCTSVCPVVAVCEAPGRDLDLTPQQIMNMLRMGLKDQTLAARMVWSCTTCYKCQEHCPQDIPVADILFELRQIATERLKERRITACPLHSATSGRYSTPDDGPTSLETSATTTTAPMAQDTAGDDA